MTNVIRKTELCRRLGVSPSTIWRWLKRGDFPKPIRLGPNTIGWLQSDLDHWLAEKASETAED